jgi:hypothetical protein
LLFLVIEKLLIITKDRLPRWQHDDHGEANQLRVAETNHRDCARQIASVANRQAMISSAFAVSLKTSSLKSS